VHTLADRAPVDREQYEIQDHQVRPHPLVLPPRGITVYRFGDLETLTLQVGAQELDDLRLVIDRQFRIEKSPRIRRKNISKCLCCNRG